jgi:hypothetical protein
MSKDCKRYVIQICGDQGGDSTKPPGEGERKLSTLFSVPYHYSLPPKPPIQGSIRWLNEYTIRVDWEPSDCPGEEVLIEIHYDGSLRHSLNVPEPTCYW